METSPITAAVTGVKPEERGTDEVAFAQAQARDARTPLGRLLWEIRARIVASGIPLLSCDEIDRSEPPAFAVGPTEHHEHFRIFQISSLGQRRAQSSIAMSMLRVGSPSGARTSIRSSTVNPLRRKSR